MSKLDELEALANRVKDTWSERTGGSFRCGDILDLLAAVKAADAWLEASLRSSKKSTDGKYPAVHKVQKARSDYAEARKRLEQ